MLKTLTSPLAALSLLAAASLAHAEEPTKSYPDCGREPTDAEVSAAKGAFQAGEASFNEADYARAIDYWEDAYRRDCTANPLLLNLARAYELAGRKRQAVVALETFLEREQNSGERDQINRRIEVLKKKIAEEDAAAAAAAPPPTNGGAQANGATQPPPDRQAPVNVRRSVGPWILIGVGGAVTVIGGVGYLTNKKKIDDAEEACGPGGRSDCADDKALQDGNDARQALIGSGVLAGVGVAAIGGGILWWYLDGKRVARAQAQTALVPVLGPQLAGLSLSGSF